MAMMMIMMKMKKKKHKTDREKWKDNSEGPLTENLPLCNDQKQNLIFVVFLDNIPREKASETETLKIIIGPKEQILCG